jgi:hypothetical protein
MKLSPDLSTSIELVDVGIHTLYQHRYVMEYDSSSLIISYTNLQYYVTLFCIIYSAIIAVMNALKGIRCPEKNEILTFYRKINISKRCILEVNY